MCIYPTNPNLPRCSTKNATCGGLTPRTSPARSTMKLLDQVRHLAREKHLAYRTEDCYVAWITRFIRHHDIRHPNTMGAPEVEQFLTHLAVKDSVSASTQNQALAALLFLYRDVLQIDIG